MITKTTTVAIPEKELVAINRMATMSAEQIYDKFGYCHDETILCYTANFGNGIEMDIKLINCSGEEKPYLDFVLFYNSCECNCEAGEPEDFHVGDKIELEYDHINYVAEIVAA